MRLLLSSARRRRDRKIAELRAAQAAGQACVRCGTPLPTPWVRGYANGMAGFICNGPCPLPPISEQDPQP